MFILTVLVISIRGIFQSIKQIQSVNNTKSFRKTMGTITDISLWYTIEVNKETDDTPLFKIVKTYGYQVNGKPYSNNKNQLFDDDLLKHYKPVSQVEAYNKWILKTDNYKKSLAKVKAIKQKNIPVFYDKENPTISCLSNNIDTGTTTRLALYVVLLLIAGGATYFLLRK